MEDLGTLPGDTRSYARDLNDRGDIVGYSRNDEGVPLAVIWTKERGIEDLGNFGGENIYAFARHINNRGQVVCIGDLSFESFVWSRKCGLQKLQDHVNPKYFASGTGINERGQIAGTFCILATGHCRAALMTPIREGTSTADDDE